MKKLLTILFLLSVIAVSAQNGNSKHYPLESNTYGAGYYRVYGDTCLYIPDINDTLAHDNTVNSNKAQIRIFQGELWYKPKNGYWKKTGNGGGGGNVDLSAYYTKVQVDNLLASNSNGQIVVNIKSFNPNIGDSVTVATDAFNAAKAFLATKGGGTIYFPAGKYVAADNNGWLAQSNITLKGDGIGKTFLLPAAGNVNGGLQIAPYRDAGWLNQAVQVYTYEDSAAIGQDYIVMKAGQDLSAFKPGTSIFINDGASYYDQLYGEHNIVDKVQGNRVYLKDNLSRDYTVARGSWAGTLTQAFTIPAVGQSAIAYMNSVPNVSQYYGVSINNNIFQVVAVTGTSATLLNLGKGNATGTLPAGTTVMKSRSVILTPSTVRNVTVEDMTVIGRRKALNISNSYNTYFHNVQFKWLPAIDSGGLTIDGDDGKYATLDHCSVEAPYYFASQIARSFVGFKAINTTFHNSSIDFTEFATGEIANCTFDEGREIDSAERLPNNPALTIGTSASNVYVHDNIFRISNRVAAIGTQPDIQGFVGQSGNTVAIENNTIYCNNCNLAINIIRNGGISILHNKIFGSMRYIFNVDGRLYADSSNQRSRNSNWFQYINSCKVEGNIFGGYTNALNFRSPHNVEFINNDFNRLGGFSISDSATAISLGNIIKAPDTLPVQRLVMRGNTFTNWVLKSNSFNVGAIDSLKMDISLNYFYSNAGTGAKDSIVTLFTPFDNRYKNTAAGSSFTGVTVNTGRQVQFYENADGTITIQAVTSSIPSTAIQTTEGQTLSTTEGETITFN